MNRYCSHFFHAAVAGILFASGNLTVHADFHGHLPGFFQDDFDRADSEDIGDGWVEENGSWVLLDERVVPGADGVEDKILAFEDVEPVEYPFLVSADMTGLSASRWGGVAVHIQPFSGDTYYSLIARVEDPAEEDPQPSAIQFRRYNWGLSETLATRILEEDLTLDDYFRYTIVSTQPGVFELRLDKLDQETGEFVENLVTFNVADEPVEILEGGRAGLHSNAGDDQIAFNRFVINSQELTETVPDLTVYKAAAVEYAPEAGRVTRLQTSADLNDWENLHFSTVSLGAPVTEVFSTRFIDREFFRVISEL